MKRKRIFKSLAEISADSLGAADADAQKTDAPEPPILAEPPRKIPPGSFAHIYDIHGYHNWGINE